MTEQSPEYRASGYIMIPTDAIEDPEYEMRFGVDDGGIAELADSIRSVGLLHPLVVVRTARGYRLISGHRRLLACRSLGMKEIPAEVREVEGADQAILGFVENDQREDLNPLEQAVIFAKYLEASGRTVSELAAQIGRPTSYVSKRLMLLDMPEGILRAVAEGRLTLSHALELHRLPDASQQAYLADIAEKNGVSVSLLHTWVDQALSPADAPVASAPSQEMEYSPAPAPTAQCFICGRDSGQAILHAQFVCVECERAVQAAAEQAERGARAGA